MPSHPRVISALMALALASLCTGCLARQVANDGVNARQALLDMYTDQVMDNLIRAHDNLPFVQVQYSDVTVQDADLVGSTLAVNWPVQATTYGATGNASRSRTMSFVANPISDQNDIYDAYLTFANDPGLFIVTCDDPGEAAHICRKHDKKYYWVPVEAGPMFLNLAMITTFKRGPESVPPGAYEVTIVDVKVEAKNGINPKTGERKYPMLPADLIEATLTFSESLPNGDATMIAKLTDGRTFQIPLHFITKDIKDGVEQEVKQGDLTTKLKTADWSPQKTLYTDLDLRGARARIYSQNYPATTQVIGSHPLQRINSNLNYIRNLPQVNKL